MNNPAGFGGILLLIAAVAWLVVFVPGYSSRAQLSARTSMVRRAQKQQSKNIPLTPQQRLIRLTNTQRTFSVLFALLLITAISLGVSSAVGQLPWFGSAISFVAAVLALAVSRAAARAAGALAQSIYSNRERIRNTAARKVAQSPSRDWAPNPLPAPLAANVPKREEKMAEVINITAPARSISSRELDEILARRRAI